MPDIASHMDTVRCDQCRLIVQAVKTYMDHILTIAPGVCDTAWTVEDYQWDTELSISIDLGRSQEVGVYGIMVILE